VALNRKEFLREACLSGICLCGFSALATAKDNAGNHESVPSTQDNNNALLQEWISVLLSNLNSGLDKEELRKTIKKSSIVHYNNLKMDEMLKDYENNLEKFIVFIEEKWGWKIEYNAQTKTIIANENKNYCVCPMVNKEKGISSAICYCSEGFAEKMFSKVIGRTVNATVVSSIQRGDISCKYKIEWAI